MDLNERILNEAAPDVSDDAADTPDPAAILRSWHDMHGNEGADRRTILVVDDDATIRILLRAALGRVFKDFDIVDVPGPREALEFLADGAGRTAKVFTDNQMPWMTGVDFARVLRGGSSNTQLPREAVIQLHRVPISLITGDADLSEAHLLQGTGTLHAVVRKPFTMNDIAQGVTAAVGRMRAMQVAVA